ncbi:MAG TPA: DUF922 domain-containing protein [Synechococcales cyanobacterium M55_K2018_004]|nr:DUF922 domain-containing protein [Synechococcales cyanobacterium M55_K2018_004]
MSVRKKRRPTPKDRPVQNREYQQQQSSNRRWQGQRSDPRLDHQPKHQRQKNQRSTAQQPQTPAGKPPTAPNAQGRSPQSQPQSQRRVQSRAVTWQSLPPSQTRLRSGRSQRHRINMTPILGFFIVAIVGLDVLHGSHRLWTYLTGSGSLSQQRTTTPVEALASPQSQPLPGVVSFGSGGGTDPKVSVRTITYNIVGDTAEALRSQMSQFGPEDRNTGRRFDGFTSWNVDWKYTYKTIHGECFIERPVVKTDIEITLPKWIPSSSAQTGLVERWNRYIAALTEHENGHRDHGILAGRAVAQMLSQLQGTSSCQELVTLADQSGAQIVQRYAQADMDYDRETGHGATQGAVFP